MAPDLVVATSSFTTYPSGVIALRCTDWMGAARGTLSDETDARAITGEVVRDTQAVTTSIFSDPVGAYQEAEDTLEIDFSTLPIEGAASNGMTYRMLLSLIIEGDWDTTNSDTFQQSTQHEFVNGCDIGFHGVPGAATDASPLFANYRPRDRPHYVIVSLGRTDSLVGDEVLHVRAYARDGTTIEILLDEIILVPMVVSGTKLGQWRNTDFKVVGGQHNTFGFIGYDPPNTGTGFVDGADGGDSNGKFTWMPIPWEEQTSESSSDGGGDYQKDPDDEYMIRVVKEDGYLLWNSDGSTEVPAVAYSVHGSNWRDSKTWVDDDFTRTVADGTGVGKWGTGPQGFGWWTTQSNGIMGVNGAAGVMQTNNLIGQSSCRAGLSPSAGGSQAAAQINAPNYTFSGVLNAAGSAAADNLFVNVDLIGRAPAYPDFSIVFDLVADTWTVTDGGVNVFEGPHATPGTTIGWKVEILRHRLRVKVWDAGGAEPGTWDYDDFPPNGADAYPYGDDLDKSTEFVAFYPVLSLSGNDVNPNVTVTWDDVLIEYDSYGDPGDMTTTIEQPDGSQVGTIDIPYGAWQMVHWGTRDWTELDAGDPYLSFSGKAWSESGVAETQRADSLFWWFRSTRGGIVPMNWRSSERPGSVWRVLVGHR